MSTSLAYDIYNEGGLLNGRYQKLENIAEGAYGYVSLAKDTSRSELVAVKYIYPMPESTETDTSFKDPALMTGRSKSMVNYSTREVVCEEAKHEISIHQQLGEHPNIISCVDYFDSFIILEYCSRGDLYEAIQSDTGPQTTRDIINVTVQLIEAVEYAHNKGIYHRDIKPENVLIATNGSIRLSDWGLATTERYCDDFAVGSERYMAPELFDQGNIETYDASKCDIWSIGIVLLNIVFKKNPFNVANQTDKSFAYFASNREALFDIFSSMSNDLFTALRHCLTLDPDNRDLGKLKEELLKVQSLTIDDDIEIWNREEEEKQQQLAAAARETEKKLKAAAAKRQMHRPVLNVDPVSPRIPQIKVSYVNNNNRFVRRNHYDPLTNHRRYNAIPRAEPAYNQPTHNNNNSVTPSKFIPINNNNNGSTVTGDKSFDVHTPNTHINNHFQNFRKDMFNRTDYFTPPSVSAHYMEKFDQDRKKSSNSNNRRQSFVETHSAGANSEGKYLPPFKQRLSHSKPTTSTSHQIISPSSSNNSGVATARNSLSTINQRKTSSFNSGKYIPPNLRARYQEEAHHHYEAVMSDDEEDNLPSDDDDDELFVLEEPSLRSGLSKLEITKSQDEDALDSDTSTAPSTSASSQSGGLELSAAASKSPGKSVYVPPHHRGNFNQTLDKNSFRNFLNAPKNTTNKPPKRRHSTNTHSLSQSNSSAAAHFKKMFSSAMDQSVLFEEDEEESDQLYDGGMDRLIGNSSSSSNDGEVYSQIIDKNQQKGGVEKTSVKERVLNFI
ncbi:hypothetical protein WICPIJ_009427 [Wickerhamomyces pijperi]|uniref:Protein kinase domain-containing protein n=1 Tax=Wickerhamomyces pijperi TaxID=599730 RepID=A0A9P8PML2_WICPI|nr:hypothetical protein WICPIJ_009427 [Wickerhamomyces pijperi]